MGGCLVGSIPTASALSKAPSGPEAPAFLQQRNCAEIQPQRGPYAHFRGSYMYEKEPKMHFGTQKNSVR